MTNNLQKFHGKLVRATVCGMALMAGAMLTATTMRAQAAEESKPEPDATATPTAPYAELQYGTLTGTTNAVNVTLVPVLLENGKTVYYNLTIPLTVTQATSGSTTTVTVAAGTVSAVPAPTFQVSAFKAGNYVGPGGGKTQLLTLAGPGTTSNGATEWSTTTTAGETGCTWPTSSNFYVGPLTSNPLYARIKAAGITTTNYSFGIMNQSCGTENGNIWHTGSLIGFSQIGTSLIVVSYSNYGGDSNVPQSTITYSLIQ